MIDKRFLNFKTKSAFESLLNDGQINENSIAFIEGDEQSSEPNLIWTHGQYYMGGSGVDPQIEEDVDQLKDDVSDIYNLIYDIIMDIADVKLIASPSTIFVNDTQTITLNATTNKTASSITISKGETILGEGEGNIFNIDDLNVLPTESGSIVYSADFTINGLHKSINANVHTVNKIFYGIGTENDYSGIIEYQSPRINASGDYTFTTTEQKPYIYILQPYDMPQINLNLVYLNNIPYNLLLLDDDITINGVRYRVYRSVSDNQSTTFTLTIN